MSENIASLENKITYSVGVVAIREGKVLLVTEEEGSGHITGMRGLVSGRLEEGEADIDAAAREFTEETGLLADINDFQEFEDNVFIADIPRKNGEVVRFNWRVFRIDNFSGELRGNSEVTPEWVEIERLEKMESDGILLPNVLAAVQAAMKHKFND